MVLLSTTDRWETDNTHGTGKLDFIIRRCNKMILRSVCTLCLVGCTLSSALATAFSLGENDRNQKEGQVGATSAIKLVDACVLAKAYVSNGIKNAVQLGKGPGPVAQTEFPSSSVDFPAIVTDPTTDSKEFRPMKAFSSGATGEDGIPVLGRILPIVDTVDWVHRLAQSAGVTDIQLRIKDQTDPGEIVDRVRTCQKICETNGVRLWVNDHWEAAVEAGCFGVHVGQEDLCKLVNKAGGLETMRTKNIALGISTRKFLSVLGWYYSSALKLNVIFRDFEFLKILTVNSLRPLV